VKRAESGFKGFSFNNIDNELYSSYQRESIRRREYDGLFERIMLLKQGHQEMDVRQILNDNVEIELKIGL